MVSLTQLIATMPYPKSLTSTFSKNWETKPIGLAGDLLSKAFNGRKDFSTTIKAAFISAKATAGGEFYDLWLANNSQAVNPRNKAMFIDIPFRTMDFSWTLSPRSASEARDHANLIFALKALSAPSLDDSGSLFTYPDTFSLEIPAGNNMLFKSPDMAMTSISTDLITHGVWSEFKDNYPTFINLSVSFVETQLATQELILSQDIV